MPRRRAVYLLLGFVLVSCAALAAFGVKTTIDDARRDRQKYGADAAAAADAWIRGLLAVMAEPDRIATALFLDARDGSFSVDGRKIAEPPAETRPTTGPTSQQVDPGPIIEFHRRTIDQLDARGADDAIRERLGQLAVQSEVPALAAWALATDAAFAMRRKDDERARAVLTRLIAEHPRELDDRGVPRSLTARLLLVEIDREPVAAATLFADLVDRHRSIDDTAIGYLKLRARRVAEAAVDKSTDAKKVFSAADAADRVRSIPRRAAAVLGTILARLTASPQPQPFVIDLPPDPLVSGETKERQLILPTANGTYILDIDEILRRAAGRPEATAYEQLGFRSRAIGEGARDVADAAIERLDVWVLRPLPAPLGETTLEVRGESKTILEQRERARIYRAVFLVGMAVILACGAAWMAVRAMRREISLARDREQFAAAVTHELKAPIASIRLLAELIEPGDLPQEKARDFSKKIVRESDRLGRLVRSVLEWSELEHQSIDVRALAEIELTDLLAEAVDAVRPTAEAAGYSFAIRAPTGKKMAADRDAMVAALVNLLDNAVKYSDRPHEIEVEAVESATTIEFSVADRGRGVPLEEVERIFLPFTRVGDEMTRDRPGVGLGLALVKKIAEAHGGRVFCTPRDGGGSRFTLALPRKRP